MIVHAALDLRDGLVVQWVGGRPETERVALPDPAAVARRWADAGFPALHIVDLDAALGRGSNAASARAILDDTDVPVQVGGGIRDDDAVATWLDAGAARVVVGTRAVEDPDWVEALARRHPDRIVVAADMRDGQVLSRGWTEDAGLAVADLLARLEPLPLAGVLVTDVGREGQMAGADIDAFRALAGATRHPLQASGGIRDSADVAALADAGVHAAVLGMALYTGAIDPVELWQRLGVDIPMSASDTS